MSVKQRLIDFIKFKKLSQARFERAIGLSNGFVNNISKGIGADKLQRIIGIFPDLNADWLMTGNGEMLNPPKNDFSQITEKEMSDMIAEGFSDYLMKMFKEGEIYSAEMVKKMIAEKDAKIEELQRRIWELEQTTK